MIFDALTVRPLPAQFRGVATYWHDLDGRWAVPGVGYGDRIVKRADEMRQA
jgi:hypothetical protein